MSLDLHGWAVDRADPSTPAILHLLVDGQEIGVIQCAVPRPDVRDAGKGPEAVGYQLALPPHLADGKPHRLEMRDRRRREVAIHLRGTPVLNVDFTITWTAKVASYVDGLRNGAFEGWVMATERGDPAYHGNRVVRVTCDGATIGHVRANRHRGDVARAMQGAPNCGFQFLPPAHVRSRHPRRFGFFLLPDGIELDGSPHTTSLVGNAEEARILDLVEAVDTMHRELTRIRRQLREMVPRPGHSIAGYDRWFREYEPALRRRMAAQRPPDDWASGPLVSVVCPVFRPLPQDFRAAVDSVLAQTYPNWELILVDDGSRDAALSAVLADMAGADPRIRLIVRKKNAGISAATNVALDAARGAWVAFFDHDDALVDTALECMVTAARATGARLLYSDEDKVDEAGTYTAPAFKPDWNHRLLLGVNYVCHLLFVEKALLDATGPLSTRHNGAQDHDLILRLSERVDPAQIHHVPEMLYHWRITQGSTAATMSNKSYATDAGVLAVSDHLARLGRPADVESIDGMTLYRADWRVDQEPRVTVIIPFKDQIATTEQCLAALMQTDYANFDVILVDNWSTAPELARLEHAVADQAEVRILRVEQEFNYSRLNNLAAAESDADYLVFMNNDLFVTDPGWLRAAVNEAVVDPAVAAVGGKFYYPNGTIQHAGVVLGIGGVAGHVHVGLPAGDNGYGGRVLFPQEMSAVTAAGMLVRVAAFRAVGGFDEEHLRVAFNDIDLCLKLRRAGHKIIWTPDFVADHHESLSRGNDERPVQEARFFDEIEVMKARWGDALTSDPFYHPAFALDRQAFFDLNDPA
ncbi:MAG: glycosyltransferase [Gemmatimonadaceae bacterium]|nr:glycosyltransferase [Acetobacteraceae bacterium]